MAFRRSNRIVRGGRLRRETRWLGAIPVLTGLSAASTAVLSHVLTTEEKALLPFTVVRTRGIFHIFSDQLAASEQYVASLGMAVVSDQAVSIGVTAVPTPATDRNSDMFFVYETLMGALRFSTAAGFRDIGQLMQFDSKAMRKVEEGQDIAITQETEAISSGANVTVGFRMLVKLH